MAYLGILCTMLLGSNVEASKIRSKVTKRQKHARDLATGRAVSKSAQVIKSRRSVDVVFPHRNGVAKTRMTFLAVNKVAAAPLSTSVEYNNGTIVKTYTNLKKNKSVYKSRATPDGQIYVTIRTHKNGKKPYFIRALYNPKTGEALTTHKTKFYKKGSKYSLERELKGRDLYAAFIRQGPK